MKSSFAARRKPKAIARDEVDDDDPKTQSDSVATASAVKKPNARPKSLSTRQISFSAGASRSTSQNTSDNEEEPFVIKKSTLSQQAIARNAQRKSGTRLFVEDRIPSIRAEVNRPSYSRDALALLKDSTPVTPASGEDNEDDLQLYGELDVAAKFGNDYLDKAGSASIPTDAEIAEKKARRARIAKELKYNAESGSDDEPIIDVDRDSDDDEFRMQVDRVAIHGSRKPKHAETRFTRDDEDIMEGFDEFTQDSNRGRIEIGRKAEKEAKKRARLQMQSMIEEAEGSGSEDSDDSEHQRKELYEATQTRNAIGTSKISDLQDDAVPPKLPSIPTIGGILDKLRSAMEEIDLIRQTKQREIEEIEQERREIVEREDGVQQALKETAEQYQRLSIEAGLRSPSNTANISDVNGALALRAEDRSNGQRGLEDLT